MVENYHIQKLIIRFSLNGIFLEDFDFYLLDALDEFFLLIKKNVYCLFHFTFSLLCVVGFLFVFSRVVPYPNVGSEQGVICPLLSYIFLYMIIYEFNQLWQYDKIINYK